MVLHYDCLWQQMASLVNSVLTKMARKVEDQNFGFTYAHDVLLPEVCNVNLHAVLVANGFPCK